MIGEFGVEPEVLAHWKHFQALWGDFGIAQRRQIGLYPKKWKQVTIDRARALIREGGNREIQVAKMIERMSGDGSKAKFRKTDCSDWRDRPWIENAIEHCPAFDAVIATVGRPEAGVLVAGEFLRDEPPYVREPNLSIPRTKVELVAVAWPLLIAADRIVIVEPNFDPMEPRFLDTLIHLVERLQDAGTNPKRFELHTCKLRDGENRVKVQNYKSQISPHLPKGWSLVVCCWAENLPKDYLHPRLILTELGGIQYDYGLDVGPDGSVTLVSALGETNHQQLVAHYSGEGTAFANDAGSEQFTIT